MQKQNEELRYQILLSHLADLAHLCSNHWEWRFTLDELRKLAVLGDAVDGLSSPAPFQAHELSKRLGPEKLSDVISKYKAGASAQSLAREHGIAASALLRMLRAEGVPIRTKKVSDEQARQLRDEYDAGATMAELEKRHGLSHGVVYRALHRVRQ